MSTPVISTRLPTLNADSWVVVDIEPHEAGPLVWFGDRPPRAHVIRCTRLRWDRYSGRLVVGGVMLHASTLQPWRDRLGRPVRKDLHLRRVLDVVHDWPAARWTP